MNILVTGGAGAIGSNLVKKLIQHNFKVFIIDDLSSGFVENVHPKATFIEGSITDKQFLTNVFSENKFDVVYHLAALFANQNSIDHPEKDLKVNGLGTLYLLELSLEQYKTGHLKRFIYSSSSCVYGMFDGKISEDVKPNTETPYAISKLMGEHYVKFFHEQYSLPTTSFRFFNVFGPGEKPGKYRNVIPNFIDLALKGLPLKITGTGNETRDFTYIDDALTCLINTINVEKANGKIYNLATGRETKIIDLARIIIDKTNSKSIIEFMPRRDWDHTTSRCGNIDLAQIELGYKPTTSVEDGLAETIKWFKDLHI